MDPAFKERRKAALAQMARALEADEDDDYCAGYDQLIAAEQEAGEFDTGDVEECQDDCSDCLCYGQNCTGNDKAGGP